MSAKNTCLNKKCKSPIISSCLGQGPEGGVRAGLPQPARALGGGVLRPAGEGGLVPPRLRRQGSTIPPGMFKHFT